MGATPRFIMFPKNDGDLRAQGGRGKHIQICLCLAQSIFFELPRPVNEATKPKATTERGDGSASGRRERRRKGGRKTGKNAKLYLLAFLEE